MFKELVEKYKKEFNGKGGDTMRQKAEALIGADVNKTSMEPIMSLNTPSNEKMRQFKKGGTVRKPKMIPGGSLTDLHIPTKKVKMKIANNHTKSNDVGNSYKAGGSVSRQDLEHPKAGIYEREMMSENRMKAPKTSSKILARNDLEHPKKDMYERDMKGGGGPKKGKVLNFAAGGVAKIRHGQSNKSGMPIKPCSMKKK